MKTETRKVVCSIIISYIVIIMPVLHYLYVNNQATIGGWDAVTQMYPVLNYVRKFWLDIFTSVTQGKVEIPMMEWTLGMGEDLIGVLNWHGFGDPFYLISVFVPETLLPHFYTFIFYFRAMLGALTFYFFARYICPNRTTLAYVVGSLSYCFVGFMVESNFHIIFEHMMVYLPLLFLGSLKVLDGKRRGGILISVFLFSLSGFFFLYIASVGLACFTIYQAIRKKLPIKEAIMRIIEMIAEYILGCCLGSIYLIPSIMAFLGSNRASVTQNLPAFKSLADLRDMFVNILMPNYEGFHILSVSSVSFVILILLLTQKERHRERVIVLILWLLACIPWVNCVMSGFGEAYDRWIILITFYFAYLVVEGWDDIVKTSWLQRIILLATTGIFWVLAKYFHVAKHQKVSVSLKTYIFISLIICIGVPLFNKIKKNRLFYFLLFATCVISLSMIWKQSARAREISYLNERNVVRELKALDSKEFYRIDNSRSFIELRLGQNHGFYMGYPSVSEYFSIENPYYTNAMLQWNVNPQILGNHMMVGVDYRGALESLASVKYYIRNKEQPTIIPYGFELIRSTDDGEWSLYENKYALPIVYVYDHVFDEKKIGKINGFQKQNLMMQAAILQGYEGNIAELQDTNNDLIENEIQFVNVPIEYLHKPVYHMQEGDSIEIKVKLIKECENYLYIGNLEDGYDGGVLITTSDGRRIEVGNAEGYHNGSFGINLGTADKTQDIIAKLTFSKRTSVEKKQLKSYAYSYSHMEEYIAERKAIDISLLKILNNKIVLNENTLDDKILCLAAPYSKGWRAKIDGSETKIFVANDMYMGIEVPKGRHQIEFSYRTPGIGISILITILAILCCIIYILLLNKKRNRSKWGILQRLEGENCED